MSVRWGGCIFTWLLLVFTRLGSSNAQISDLRLCADPKCKEPISSGRTIISYPSNDERILSFPVNAEVTVYSKEAGSRQDLWGVEIKGKTGYAPKQYIREQKIFVSKPKYEVPTEAASTDKGPPSDKSKEEEKELSNESFSEADTKVVETEPQVEEVPLSAETEEVEAEPQVDEVALSAEDIEYKQLKKASKKKQEEEISQEAVDKEEENLKTLGDEKAEKPSDETNEHDIEHEEGEEDEQDEDEDKKIKREEEEMEEEEEEDSSPNQGEPEEQPAVEKDEEKLEDIEDGNKKEPSKSLQESDSFHATLTKGDSSHAIPKAEPVIADKSEHSKAHVNDNPSPNDYEVIDGTTIYFDDTTPIPPTSEVAIPETLMSSSVNEADYVTEYPSPILPQAAFEDSHAQNADIHVTTAVNSEFSPSVSLEGAIESSATVTESSSAATEGLQSEAKLEEYPEVSETEDIISPTSSWLSEATATVSSWLGAAEKELNPTEAEAKQSGESTMSSPDEDQDSDFGDPKEDSVINTDKILDDNVKENESFFSSWFGSTDENPEISSKVSESSATKTDNEEASLDLDSLLHNSSIETSEPELVDDNVSSDTTQTLVEPLETPDVIAQPLSTADSVVNVVNTQTTDPSPVDASPEVTAVPNPELYSESPVAHDEILPTQDAGIRLLSDQEDHNDTEDDGDEEEPSTSTARPLYAVPDPAVRSHPDSNAEQEELVHLAGKGSLMEGSEVSDEEAADASLSEGFLKTSHNLLPEGLAFGFEAELAEPKVSSGMLVFLLIVAGTVITIYFIHLIMTKISREGPLVAVLNRVSHESRVMADEHEALHAELTKARAELDTVSSRITTSSGDVDELNSQLEVVKESLAQVTDLAVTTEKQLQMGEEDELLAQENTVLMPNEYASEKGQLEERIEQLEHELEEATTNCLEMHKMLSEMLSAQKDATSFQASVDHLQSMLDGQREKVETLTSDLALKNRLNEELHSELSASMERASKLDYQVEQLTHSLEELTGVKGEATRKLQEEAAIVEELKVANASLTEQAGEYDTKVATLSGELGELRDTIGQLRESIETKESELEVAKECLKQLRLTSSDDSAAPDEEKLSALFDVIRVKAELQKVNNERLTLVEQLQDAEMAQKNLEDTMASIRTEVSELRNHHDMAVKEKQEAQSKLEVLTKYFEEKEAQLTKELESQEGLRANAEGSAAAVAKKIQNYELELASYKKLKKIPSLLDGQSKKHCPLSHDSVSLSDLSPTTANVPMSDEYKVECVKAKAELRRRKDSASSTDKSDKASSSASRVTSSDSLHHSSDCLAYPSDSSVNVSDSSIEPKRKKDRSGGSGASECPSHIPSGCTTGLSSDVPETNVIPSSSLPRPSSLTVTTRPHPVSVVHSLSNPSVFHRMEQNSGILEAPLQIPSLCLDDEVSASLKETPASDDFKSSVAAIRSFYEAKKGKLSVSGTRSGDRFRTQVESLRKELEEQETSYKTQIASHEQKAHDNWLQARATERKHEEQRQENSQLRSRLTMLQKEKEEAHQSQVNIIKPTPKRVDANGTMSSPRPMVDGVDGDRSGPTSLHHNLDSPPIPPHPLHGPPPPMLPMMFPPGGPLPPGVPPPHGLPPGVPPPPPGLPHGVPPPHGLPPHPFLPGEPPFMGPLPPLPGDRRIPPAGGMSSPPFRRSGSPSYDHRNDRYSPLSDRSHISDRRYSPPPLRRRPLSPDMHRNRSPDRRSDRTRSPDRRSDRMMRSPDRRNERRLDRRSPDRHYNRSPDGYTRHRTSPRNYYDDHDYDNDDPRLRTHMKGKKTSTPLGPGDR